MATESGPFDINDVRLVLSPDGTSTVLPVTPTFFEDLGKAFGDFAGRVLVSRFDFDEPWPTWEMHPKADEFVYLLSGDVELLVKAPGEGAVTIRVSEPGRYVIVPRGHWHTARPLAPTSMLFVTAGEGTQNEVEPPE